MYEAEGPRHDHCAAFDCRLRFFVPRFSAGQVVPQHALVAFDRVNRADHAFRREEYISYRAVGHEQPRHAVKAFGSAFVLHDEGFQRLCLVQLSGEHLIRLCADGARDEFHLVVFSGASAVFNISTERRAERERNEKRGNDRLCDPPFSQ
ncbi:hypothetical protein SDC9_129324 [bioreactor metagenome]|uniref:Uncharacterized protein n=1 Tax=bioreactor metagenome TaxID=1076179 RepID=A0A645CZH5_9ZZZZ